MSNHNFILAATVTRLSLALLLAVTIHHSFFISTALLILIVVADLFDGIWARKHKMDTNVRRTVDATVDMLSVFIVVASVIFTSPQYIVLCVPLLARDILSSLICSKLFFEQKILLIGGNWHKGASLSKAALLFFILYGDPKLILLSALVSILINYVLLFDYYGAYLIATKSAIPYSRRMVVSNLYGLRVVIQRILLAKKCTDLS